jgi:outer membrane protein
MIGTALPLMAAAALQPQDTMPVTPSPTAAESNSVVDETPPKTDARQVERSAPRPNVKRQTSRWFVRVGALGAFYNSSARIATGGSVIPGASAHATDSKTIIFDIGYDISDDVAVMFMGGIPPTANVMGRGTVASAGKLGKVRFGPAILTGVYRLPEWHGFRPYVGAGVAHLFILKEYDGSVKGLKVRDDWGPVLQAGVEYRLTRKWELFADYKRVGLSVPAKGYLGGEPVRARVTLNPDLFSAGIKFHFG